MYLTTLSPEEQRLLCTLIADLETNGRLALVRTFIQHGSTSVFVHCVKVACFSLSLAKKLHISVDTRALLRGALLHDYFLYDWHEKDAGHRFHGFTHPATALKNAQEDFALTPIEQNIIVRHMFPLCPIPPRCREAWLVCAADKYCALLETLTPLLRTRFFPVRPNSLHHHDL